MNTQKIFSPTFPYNSIWWIFLSIGFIVISVFIFYFDISEYTQRKEKFLMLAPLFIISSLWMWKDLFLYFVVKNKNIILDEKEFQIWNASRNKFEDIEYIYYDVNDWILNIFLYNKEKYKIYENIYTDFIDIQNIFYDNSFPFIYNQILNSLKQWNIVSFGSKINMSLWEIIYKKYNYPISLIKTVDIFRTNDNWWINEELVIKLESGKKISILTRYIANIHVLIDIITKKQI